MRFLRIPALLALCVAMSGYATYSQLPQSPAPAGSSVEILIKGGIGSGVHIGNGYILTAAHVAEDNATVTVKDDKGDTHDGKVLWSNKDYDIALVRTDDTMASAQLDCRASKVGESITTRGNPMGVEFLTTWGHVAGKARKWGPWESVIFTDLTLAPGNSGGGVYDENGNVVGIAVGVMLTRVGVVPNLTGFSTVVPSSVICELLAR